MARQVALKGNRKTMITVDLGNSKMKSQLVNIAKNKGLTLTNFIRSTLFKVIEDTPVSMRTDRYLDDQD